MACKTCGDPTIDKAFSCHSCHVRKDTFKWCVITGVPRDLEGKDAEGNLYDDFIDLKKARNFHILTKNGKLITDFSKYKNASLMIKKPVFHQGDVFPIEPDFEREVSGRGRKAAKWDVEYELYPAKQYKKAILRAIQATKEYYEPWDNLKYVEQEARKKGL